MSEQTGRPGRYQRSFGGLIGSMLVLLLVVGAFVVFRELTRENPTAELEPVDYVDVVAAQQQAGRTVVYPGRLPDGWVATSASVEPGDRPVWRLGVHTDAGDFVGLRQQDASAAEMLEIYGEKRVETAAPVTVTGALTREWQGYTVEGGDEAYAAEVGENTVVVYGSAPARDLRAFIETLTTEPLRG